MIELRAVASKEEYQLAKQLFSEYVEGLGFDISFQNFTDELDQIDKLYAKPAGLIHLAYSDQNHAIGCFGIREIDEQACELKRMYIHKDFRGKGIGKIMLEKAIEEGINLGYQSMRLDTLDSMRAAIKLYENAGFYEIEAYRYNPFENAKFFEKKLM